MILLYSCFPKCLTEDNCLCWDHWQVFVFPGKILRDLVSPGAWLESALWPKKDAFLFQDSRNPGISLGVGEGNGETTIRSKSWFGIGPLISSVSHFLYFFSSVNLKHGGLYLALQEILKWLFGINRFMELSSQNYPSCAVDIPANCCRCSVLRPRLK